MVMWTVLDSCNMILDRTGAPGLAVRNISSYSALEHSPGARYITCRACARFTRSPTRRLVVSGSPFGSDVLRSNENHSR